MDPNIKNGMFVIRNHHVECVPKKNVTLFEKMSGKTNLFNVIHKLESDTKNNHYQTENEITQLRGRVTQLREMHKSNTKNSKFFKLMTKVYHFFGLNFLKNCDTLERLINKKQKEGFLSSTGVIPQNELTKVQKQLKNVMASNKSVEETVNKISKYNLLDSQTCNEIIEYLVRNCTKEEVHDLLEQVFFEGNTPSFGDIRRIIRHATTQEKNNLKNLILDFSPKDISIDNPDEDEIDRFSRKLTLLNDLSPQDARDNILEVFAKGGDDYIAACITSQQYTQNIVSADIENLSKEHLQKVFSAALSCKDYYLIDCFTGKVAEKMFEGQSTSVTTLDIIKNHKLFSPQPDFHILILKKAFELGIENDDLPSIMVKLKRSVTTKRFVEKIIESSSEKSDTPFLLWYSGNNIHLTNELYKDLANHISKLNDGKNAAEVYLDEFTKARLDQHILQEYVKDFDINKLKKSLQNQGYEEDYINRNIKSKVYKLTNLYQTLKEKGLSRDIINHIILPMHTGRGVSKYAASLEKSLEAFFLNYNDLFFDLRDPEVINMLLDFLINENNTPRRTFRGFGKDVFDSTRLALIVDATAQAFIKKYLERLELPKDAELYAFVLQRLANKYSTQLDKLPYDFEGIESISFSFARDLSIYKDVFRSNENEELFSFDVYKKIIDDYKPLYIHLYKPWLEGKFLTHLNELELNDKNALIYEVISKGLRNHMATQIAEGGDLFKNTPNWSPEMLLLFYSVSQDSNYSKDEKENRLVAITEIEKRFSELNIEKIEKFVGKLLDHIENKDSKSQIVAQELLSNLLKIDSEITVRLPKELKDRLEKHR